MPHAAASARRDRHRQHPLERQCLRARRSTMPTPSPSASLTISIPPMVASTNSCSPSPTASLSPSSADPGRTGRKIASRSIRRRKRTRAATVCLAILKNRLTSQGSNIRATASPATRGSVPAQVSAISTSQAKPSGGKPNSRASTPSSSRPRGPKSGSAPTPRAIFRPLASTLAAASSTAITRPIVHCAI